MRYSGKIEYAGERKIRLRNKPWLSVSSLAHLDLGFFSGARAAHFQPL